MKVWILSLAIASLAAPPPLQAQLPEQQKAQVALQAQVKLIGKDCRDANNTIEINACLGQVEQQANRDFTVFYESLLSLLKPSVDPVAELNRSQEQWKLYMAKACGAIDALYRDGTIRTAAVLGCRIQLTRSRMRDLDELYHDTLHN